MREIFLSYWWLLFPLGGFIMIAWSNWLAYQRRKAELDVLKSYISQGKDPPPEVSRAVGGGPDPADPYYNNPYGHPYYGWGRWRRWRGPYWEWRRAIIFGAMAGGFWYASRYYGGHSFEVVAVIMSVIAGASLVFALLQTMLPPPK